MTPHSGFCPMRPAPFANDSIPRADGWRSRRDEDRRTAPVRRPEARGDGDGPGHHRLPRTSEVDLHPGLAPGRPRWRIISPDGGTRPKDHPMTTDPKRVQAVFLAAVEFQ